MNELRVPEPEEVLDNLRDAIMVVGEVLEIGIALALDYFERGRLNPEPYHYSSLVRFKACQMLKDRMFEADLEPENVRNNGICLTSGRYKLKVRKTFRGELPPAGPSLKTQQFYLQPVQLLLFADPGAQDDPKPDRHVIILWERDMSFHLADMSLSYPQWGDEHSASEYWRVPVVHPAVLRGQMLQEMRQPIIIDDESLLLQEDTQNESDRESRW
jgi:hypothetical protein